ncbi:response regulator transcription factor [Segetibacter sp. 3557_3]|uniref:LuxR C-terminal-related transcriptional regulator n=1 Tax=Segetibacter sp. 3557_3 TaxID=2547429 RepID=UPI001058EDF2|nr:response regulator transcription factor [Segetibacter sp. 3557_3]TDH20656.1 response regulator transcription factor [Segetibacter sp. 3557_3]
MIKVATIEDNDAYRKALHTLISLSPDCEIVYSAPDCKNVAEALKTICPDVLIMDIELPGIKGFECINLVKNQCPSINVFMLTTFEDDDKIFDSIKAGAVGYLLKKDPPGLILEAIHKIHQGEAVMNGKIARKVLQYFSEKKEVSKSIEEYDLTTREKEILELLMKGASYKEIAANCSISKDTVFSHIRNIYKKLNVHSRSEIVAKFR